MPLNSADFRVMLANAYTETKGVPFGEYVRARNLDRDGEEAPIMRAMEMVRDAGEEQLRALREMFVKAEAPIFELIAASKKTIPLDRQIKCLARELAMRKNVYPKWVANGRMKQEAADIEIAALQAALDTFNQLQKLPGIA